ncbi:MAG: sialidase domain-containing protein [Eubacteriales bacterium]|nr:sialidase domain-containing protein [Eubacteriales bacterium]
MFKKTLSLIVALILGVSFSNMNISAETNALLIQKENIIIGDSIHSINAEAIEHGIYSRNEATIYVEYESTSNNQYQSLISAANSSNGNRNRHFHIYITPSGGLGMELRNEDNDFKYTQFIDNVVPHEEINKIAFKADATNKNYKLFANGSLVSTLNKEDYKFLPDILGLNSLSLGGTLRDEQEYYKFKGQIRELRIYSNALSDVDLEELTNNDNSGLLLDASNINIVKGEGYDLSNVQAFNEIRTLEEGTFILKYKATDIEAYQSLLSVGNGTLGNRDRHFHIYIDRSGGFGFELRNTDSDFKYTSHRPAALRGKYKGEEVYNTVAFKADKIAKTYKIFANGELLSEEKVLDFKFLGNIAGVNNICLGATIRNGVKEYLFAGHIDNAKIYNYPISDDELIALTSSTKYGKNIYRAGDSTNANYFRIPTLLKLDDGTIVSSIDARYGGTHDAKSKINIAFTKSYDGGQTWTNPTLPLRFYDYEDQKIDWPRDNVGKNKVINGSASFIDSVLLEDRVNHRLFLFADAMPAGIGFANTARGSGYKTINGNKYIKLKLNNETKYNYSIRENGIIYNDMTGTPTTYKVDGEYNLLNNNEYLYQEQYSVHFEGNMLREEKNGINVKMNVFYKDSIFKVLPTNFLVMKYSDDNGDTWSDMKIMSSFKGDEERVPLYGPGVGTQIKNGPHAGRLIVSMYSSITGEFGFLYSDDYGDNWNYVTTSLVSSGSFAEAQIIEMPNGDLKVFLRTNVGKIGVITSVDGGQTWGPQTYVSGMHAAQYGTQLSAINYSGLIDSKPAILLSAPNATNGRKDGRIWVGLIEDTGGTGYDKYIIDWKYSYQVDKPEYGFSYSCMTELPNGEIGILYEKYDSWSRQELHLKNVLIYEQLSIDELKSNN